MCGASANLGKLLLVDARTGDVRLGGAQDHMPAAPAARDGAGPPPRDGVLRWMEEWARRLAGGWYKVGEFGLDARRLDRGISLFPVVAPGMATATTQGLQVGRCLGG